jgi:hypothetical protein
MRPPAKLYELHVANLRAVADGLGRISLALRHAIAVEDDRSSYALLRTYALLLAAWAECRIRKLLYEPNGFPDQDRHRIIAAPTELDRWTLTTELAFRRHYAVPQATLSEETLPHSVFARYCSITDLIDKDLQPVIQLRNKLAHGQWAYPLNDTGDDVAQAQMDALRTETLLTLQFKRSLLNGLSHIVNDLVVSRPAFERDFDHHYKLIVEARRNLRTRSYERYVSSLRQKARRGRENRTAA